MKLGSSLKLLLSMLPNDAFLQGCSMPLGMLDIIGSQRWEAYLTSTGTVQVVAREERYYLIDEQPTQQQRYLSHQYHTFHAKKKRYLCM